MSVGVLEDLIPCDLDRDDPELRAMIAQTCAKYGVTYRERAKRWFGMRRAGVLVGAVGEVSDAVTLEVTDCYSDGSRYGTAAIYALLLGYYEKLRAGEFDNLVHTCLFENVEMWEAVKRVTGDNPYALVFVHKRKT